MSVSNRKRSVFASFTMTPALTLRSVEVVWERRNGRKPGYKGTCCICGKEHPKGTIRTIFVLRPEGFRLQKLPYLYVTSCEECTYDAEKKLRENFEPLSSEFEPVDQSRVETLLRSNNIVFAGA